MPRVSIFDTYTRTADDQAPGALSHHWVDEAVALQIDEGATPIVDEATNEIILIDLDIPAE